MQGGKATQPIFFQNMMPCHPVTCDIDACFHVKCGYHKCNIIYLTQWLIFEQWNTPMLGKHLKVTPMINIQWCISFRMCGIGQKTSRRLYTATARRKNRKSLWSGSTTLKITFMVFQHHMWRRCRSTRRECEVNATAHLQHPPRIQWPQALH